MTLLDKLVKEYLEPYGHGCTYESDVEAAYRAGFDVASHIAAYDIASLASKTHYLSEKEDPNDKTG
jgi:hypothetical protein